MKPQQQKKLDRLSGEVTKAKEKLAAADDLVKQARTDAEKKAADAQIKKAETALEKVSNQLATYEAELQQKSDDTSKSRSEENDGVGTITVTASHDRRRAGMAFAKGQPKEILRDDLDEDQLQALRDDPVLHVQE